MNKSWMSMKLKRNTEKDCVVLNSMISNTIVAGFWANKDQVNKIDMIINKNNKK